MYYSNVIFNFSTRSLSLLSMFIHIIFVYNLCSEQNEFRCKIAKILALGQCVSRPESLDIHFLNQLLFKTAISKKEHLFLASIRAFLRKITNQIW